MTEIPQFSPGCFGSALAFDTEHQICQSCKFSKDCKPVHERNLAALRESIGAYGQSPAASKRSLTKEPPKSETGTALPTKTQALVDRLDRGNYRVTEHLAQQQNPFAGKIPFLAITCQLLLKRGQVSRELLTMAFCAKLNWKEGTARAHARMAAQALTHIGATEEGNGCLRLKKT